MMRQQLLQNKLQYNMEGLVPLRHECTPAKLAPAWLSSGKHGDVYCMHFEFQGFYFVMPVSLTQFLMQLSPYPCR